MIGRIERNVADVVVAARPAPAGAPEGLRERGAAMIGHVAGELAALTLGARLADPTSGFFAMRRDVFEDIAPSLTSTGSNILLDILATAWPPLRLEEIASQSRAPQMAAGLFDARAMLDFVSLLVTKATGGVVPARFILFGFVGGLGVFVHLASLRVAMDALAASFVVGQSIATFVAMTSNFVANNLLTYRDMKLRGGAAFAGLFKYYLAGALGAVANVGVANWIHGVNESWWLSGVAGIVVGAVFNFSMSSAFVWRRKPAKSRRGALAFRAEGKVA
jgi:dolichol-phosphate mannosyltransferase